MNTRALGLLMFLPVPLVLALFTRQPLGLRMSLGLGVALMVTHRLYARPFALRHAHERCLWCARQPLGARGLTLRLREPFGDTDWRACDETHHAGLRCVLGWAHDHAGLLRLGVAGGLLLLLVGLGARACGWTRGPTAADWVALFQASVASAVLPLAVLGPRARATRDTPLSVPFPVHIQALIGTANVLWLFRLVGTLWLGLAITHLARRLGWP